MDLDRTDAALLAALEDGLPLVARPYAALGAPLGVGEREVIARLEALVAGGVIRRFGLVVRHHELGFKANAMAVFAVPTAEIAAAGRILAELAFVRLCYRRRPQPPTWPYNLFCMIHGRDRATVTAQAREAAAAAGLEAVPQDLLFSRRRFKQRGARYGGRCHVA